MSKTAFSKSIATARASLVGAAAQRTIASNKSLPLIASTSRRCYVTPSMPVQLATTLDVDIPQKHTSNEPLVLTPGEGDLGFEVTEKEVVRESVGRPIYLDAQATTPVDPRVLDAMLPYLTNQYGNPHSRTHAYGWESEKAAEVAREHIANLIGANPKDIIFTSGATESNNLSIKGVARFYRRSGKKHIITLQTEHKCVLDSCRVLQDEGFEVTYLPVNEQGLVDLQQLEAAIRPDTCLVSIMAVNNEIGVVQPMKEIGQMIKKHKGVFFHTDAAQAVGKIPMDVDAMGIDLMSISAHKVYGPKGIGACYIRRRPRVRVEPIINGGGQERGLRSGTLAPALAVGFGEACRIAKLEMQNDYNHVKALSDRLHQGILAQCDHITRNGDAEGYPGCLNLSFAYIEGESMLMAMKDVAVSSGSACTSASLEPSYVLRALGADEALAHSSIRFGLGRFTTEREVDFVVNKIVSIVKKLRDMSPLYEMVLEGIDLKSIDWAQH